MANSFITRGIGPEVCPKVKTRTGIIVAIDLGKPVVQWYTTSMPAYEIFFRCEDCKREHAIHIKIHLTEGPDHKQSLAEFFAGRSMPPQVSSLQGHSAFCLKTGRRFKLDKDEQILLVPPSAVSLPARQHS